MALIDWRRLALAGLLATTAGRVYALVIPPITANTNWSAIVGGSGPGGQPTAADTITVKNGATLTVDVSNAVAGAIALGGAAPSAGQGTLSFSANLAAVTISTASGQAGTLTLGGGGQAGNLNMANGGTLTLAAFATNTIGTFTRNATGTVGTIVLTANGTLPNSANYSTFNNLSIDSGTTTQALGMTIAGNLDVDGTLTVNNTLTVNGTTTASGTISIITTTGNKTFVGAVTLSSGSRWCVASTQCSAGTALGGNFFIQGNFANSAATFIPGGAGSVYTFNGTGAQILSGSNASSTFANFVLNNAAGLSLGGTHNLTVSASLSLSAGKITTGANLVYVSNGSAIAAGTGRFIEGNLKKPVPTGTNVAESFEVGGNTGANYSPVNLTFASVATAGDVTVSSTSGAHPQLSNNSGINTTQKLNRWWTITNGGVAFTTYSAAFTYVAGEIDAPALPAVTTPAAFVAVRWDGAGWNASAISGTPTSTALTVSGETGFGDFAMGEPQDYNFNRDTVGRFNVYDPAPLTPANSLHGFIRTKTAGTSFTLTVIHFNATATGTQAVNRDSIRVDVMDASNTGGTYTNNCSDAWTVIQTLNTAYTANSATQDIALTISNAYPSVRIKVTRTSGGTESACSSDRFAVKPNDLLVQASDSDWQTAGTTRPLTTSLATGGNVHAASTPTAATPRPFRLRATGRNSAAATTANYSGSPTVFSGFPACVLPAGCATGTLSVGPWSASGGTLSADAHYSEAGTFNLRIEDRTFANVDVVDTSQANRTIPQASPPLLVGRFVPDRFAFVSPSTPQLQTYGASCASARSFTYVGKSFGYVTAPSATLQAVNAGGAVTTNYRGTGAGGLFKLTVSGLAEAYSNNGVGPAISCKKSDLSVACSTADTPPSLDATANNGTAVYTAPGNAVLLYDRSPTTPASAYNAKISLSVVATDSSETGAGNPGASGLTTPSPLVFDGGGTGIAFDGSDFDAAASLTGGKTFVYGRLQLANAFGSHLVALPIGIETQYWNGSAFQLNTRDSCTTLSRTNITLDDYRLNLDPCETAITQASITFSAGSGRLYLQAPGAAALTGAAGTPTAGSLRLTPNLGNTASGNYCATVGGAQAAALAANMTYLQGAWTGPSYTENPSSRGTFGFYGAQPRNFIYFRENY